MKFRGNSRRGGKSDNKKDNRERSHLKAFGNAHPVNDTETNLKIRIVKEEDDDNSNARESGGLASEVAGEVGCCPREITPTCGYDVANQV